MLFGQLKVGDTFKVSGRDLKDRKEFQKIGAYHAVPVDQPGIRHVFHQTEDMERTGAKGLLIDYQGTVSGDSL